MVEALGRLKLESTQDVSSANILQWLLHPNVANDDLETSGAWSSFFRRSTGGALA